MEQQGFNSMEKPDLETAAEAKSEEEQLCCKVGKYHGKGCSSPRLDTSRSFAVKKERLVFAPSFFHQCGYWL